MTHRAGSWVIAAAVPLAITCCAGTPARADDQAAAVLKEVAAATRAAQTLSADLEMKAGGGARDIDIKGSVTLKKPNLAIVKLGAPYNQVIASDGKNVTILTTQNNQYARTAAAPNGESINVQWAIPVAMFFNPENIVLGKVSDVKSKLAAPETVEGTSYQVVELTGTQPVAYTMKLYVGPEKLVTRAAISLTQAGRSQNFSAALTNVHAGQQIADAAFAYKLPAGATEMQQPDLEGKLVAVGKEAPNFTIPSPTGGQISLAEASRGKKATIVNFWFYG